MQRSLLTILWIGASALIPAMAQVPADAVRQFVQSHLVQPDGATRLVSLHEPDARPIRKGRLGKPVEFGYKAQQ